MIKKTFNINLAGRQFVIDDDAYTLSNNYLDAIEHLVRDPEERNELTSDIEDRMAELLSIKLEERGTSIISVNMVEEVIARIGQPNDFIETENIVEDVTLDQSDETKEKIVVEEPIDVGPSVSPASQPHVKKRLYRDPMNAVFGGVCSGLAVYLGIDPIWVRLIFVALALGFFNVGSFGIMVFIYILLWIIVPQADTPVKRMEMYGQAPTLGNLAKTVTTEAGIGSYEQERIPSRSDSFSRVLQNIGKGIMIFLGIIGIPVFIGLGIAILGLIFVLLMAAAGVTIGSVGFLNELGMGQEAMWGVGCALGICITIIIPAFLAVWFLFKTLNPSLRLTRTWEIILAILWIVAFIFAAVSCSVLQLLD